MRHSLCAALSLGLLVLTSKASAQSPVYLEEPTDGINNVGAGISGASDATTVVQNPASAHFLEGSSAALMMDLSDKDFLAHGGQGFGAYLAAKIGGTLGYGTALEWIRSPRNRLAPDPGTPLRLTQAVSLGTGPRSALGLSWHHFFDEGRLDGLDTFDLGYANRLNSYFAIGISVRDLLRPMVGGEWVQRRYEIESTIRPTGTDRLEFSLGGRVGESDADLTTGRDLDAWARVSLRVARGFYLKTNVISQSLRVQTAPTLLENQRQWRLSAGLELSFGSVGVMGQALATRADDGSQNVHGANVLIRASDAQVPSILGQPRRMEKIELKGIVGQRGLTQLMIDFRRIEDDSDVSAVLLEFGDLDGGWANLRELREGILRLRRANKRVFAYMVNATTNVYYVASAAEKIYMDPAGGLQMLGFSRTTLYFKGLFDKLGVNAQFEKIEEFKAAPETFTEKGPSATALANRSALYDSIHRQWLEDIASSRKLTTEKVAQYIDEGPYTAGQLRTMEQLVDSIVTPEEFEKTLFQDLGTRLSLGAPPKHRRERWDDPRIAVIYIVGDIVDGLSRKIPLLGKELVGGETIAQSIRSARANPKVKAIVLRISSPGGSALASEVMAREVFKTRGVKPIICSLGNVAASGGYFAASGCDTIVADPMTVTGSIGIFTGKFDLSELLASMGLTWHTLEYGKRSSAVSIYRPFTDEERVALKTQLRYYYNRFLKFVSKGRAMTTGEVDAVGRGAIWSGTDALSNRLIDTLGGIDMALDMAKAKAGMSESDTFGLVMLPVIKPSLTDKLLRIGGVRQGASLSMAETIGHPAIAEVLRQIPASLWNSSETIQARLPFVIDAADDDLESTDDPDIAPVQRTH